MIVPDVPVTVRESAYGAVLVVVFMVRVDEPPPVIEDGLKPPLVIPAGNPDSLPTLRVTGPVKPLRGVTVTLYVVELPGKTVFPEGLTEMSKSALAGSTVMVRVGGLGSELPVASISVREMVYSPGVLNVTFVGLCAVEFAGDPPGNTQEYFAAVVFVAKFTVCPAPIVMSEAGNEMVALGADVVYGDN